jgi:FkbM family methyltransferase
MNYLMAKEIGFIPYVWRRLVWHGLKWFRGNECVLTLPNGVVFHSPWTSCCGADLFVTGGTLDWGTEWILAAYLHRRANSVFVDVGANIGYYSALLSPYFMKGYAFDPDRRNLEALSRLHVQHPQIEVIPMAVCEQDGTAAFTPGEESCLSSLGEGGASTFSVPCVTLDKFFSTKTDDVAALKIDIEGFDVMALKGAIQMIQRCRPVVAMEFSIEAGKPNSVNALLSLSDELRMDLYAIVRLDQSMWRCSYEFVPLTPDTVQSEWFKMVLLVPREDSLFPELMRTLPVRWSCSLLDGVSGQGIQAAFLRGRVSS